MSADEAADALRTRSKVLAARITSLDQARTSIPNTLPRLLVIETEYERNRLDAERNWVDALVADIDDGRLECPDVAALVDLLPHRRRGGPLTIAPGRNDCNCHGRDRLNRRRLESLTRI